MLTSNLNSAEGDVANFMNRSHHLDLRMNHETKDKSDIDLTEKNHSESWL
jgi:hypothetical protein